MNRSDGRKPGVLRPVKITRNYMKHAEGSVLIEVGDTKVICSASVEERVPHFLRNTGKGWVTAEYSMLPRATLTRSSRESSTGRASGRTFEIQRLIGSLGGQPVDETFFSEISPDLPPIAPRVGMVANMQANVVLEILLNSEIAK